MLGALIEMLKRRRKSVNGVFGLEVRAIDVVLFGELEFFTELDAPAVIYFLWRDNIVAQGISLYRAVTTNRYHSTDSVAPAPLAYSSDGIKHWTQHIVEIENANLKMLERHGLAARFLRYYDIVRDRAITVSLFAEPLGVSLESGDLLHRSSGELTKIADDWNYDAEGRFVAREQILFLGSKDCV
jgi:LPS sulfotransferase NodH